MNKEELYKTLVETGKVEIWSNQKWSVGLEVWDNGVVHVYALEDYVRANGMLYNEWSERVVWDWTPFPAYVSVKANMKKVKELYWRYMKEFTPSLCY